MINIIGFEREVSHYTESVNSNSKIFFENIIQCVRNL